MGQGEEQGGLMIREAKLGGRRARVSMFWVLNPGSFIARSVETLHTRVYPGM